MIYKVGILGASGRVGLEIASLLGHGHSIGQDSFELGDAVCQSKKLKSIEGVPVRLMTDLGFDTVHAWIDFSHPEATMQLLEVIDTPLVIGTTGYTDGQLQRIKAYSEKHPVLMAPNMSPGLNKMLSMLERTPVAPELGFQVVASEIHHKNKKDSPSGTLKALLKVLEDQGHENIQVQVSRAGGVMGVHEITFISDEEEFRLEHRVFDRRVFATGAMLALNFLVKQKTPKLYSFHDIEVTK